MSDTDIPRDDALTIAPAEPIRDEADIEPEDLAAFKHAFRRHAAGVAIITSVLDDGTPVGFTATSLASLSAVPPLATFNIARTASSWQAIAEGEFVAIHMLGVGNRAVAQTLAGDSTVRFAGDHWYRGPHDLPIIKDVTSWMVGRIVERFPVHNNAIVVVQIEQGSPGRDDAALLYHERRYLQPGDEA